MTFSQKFCNFFCSRVSAPVTVGRVKPGVLTNLFSFEILEAYAVLRQLYKEQGEELIISSGHEPDVPGRVPDSRHYDHDGDGDTDAFDARIWGLSASQLKVITRKARSQLGPNYDVVLEVDHIHVEYDPKD